MKKMLILFLATSLLFSFCGCSLFVPQELDREPKDPTETTLSDDWSAFSNTSILDQLDEKIAKAYENALEKEDELSETLIPVCYLASQVVAGTNYAFLCQDQSDRDLEKSGYYLVVIYEDLSGNAELSQAVEFNYVDLLAQNESSSGDQNLSGGWQLPENFITNEIPSDAADAFKAAVPDNDITGCEPMALLAQCQDNGVDEVFFCHTALYGTQKLDVYDLVSIHVDENGNATPIDSSRINLASLFQ